MITKKKIMELHDENDKNSKDFSMRVLKLVNCPRHKAMLTDIATHYSISKSRAWQVIMAYLNGIYSIKKKLKHFRSDEIEDASHLWTHFGLKENKELDKHLEEIEYNYTEYAKQSISKFHGLLIEKKINYSSNAFQVFVPEFFNPMIVIK